MLRIAIILLIFSFNNLSSHSQLFDDFSDGDFTYNPKWEGNTQNFIVNDKYELRLDAPQSGNSILYTKFNTFDSMEWNIDLNIDFNPSNANKIAVYLMINTIDLDSATGYFIEIGENGNEDNLKFYKLQTGEKSLIAEGELGLFSDPFKTKIKITKQNSGIWSIYTKGKAGYFEEDFEFFDESLFVDTAYFLLNLTYSKTRIDKFIIDNIKIIQYKSDNKSPEILYSKLLNKSKLEIFFDEQIDELSVPTTKNYSVGSKGINPINTIYNKITPNKVKLEFKDDFNSGIKYEITVNGIKDLQGNEIKNSEKTNFYIIEAPQKGDLIINEILFNPNKGGSDFIEINNISKKFINIKGLTIENNHKQSKNITIQKDYILSSGQYICISNDTNNIINNYFLPDTARIISSKLPSLDDDLGNISLSIIDTIDNKTIMIDSFDYYSEMHSPFIDNDEGISLERKDLNLNTNDKFNWTSCSTISGGATPGYKNSAYQNMQFNNTEDVTIVNSVFSPNNDGFDDELIIQYNFKESNKLANFYIFDSRGRLLSQLVNNEVLGKQGFINWSGYIDMKKAPIGIYILYFKIINENSNTIIGKKVFILADYLK